MLHIHVSLLADRRKPGSFEVLGDDDEVLASYACLGKADNAMAAKAGNPTRDPLYRYGDTPAGVWKLRDVIDTGGPGLPAHSYGPNGAIELDPVSGECADAYANGRRGIWIHAGDPSASGGLRPTNGCLRLANADMKRLVKLVAGEISTGKIRMTVEIA